MKKVACNLRLRFDRAARDSCAQDRLFSEHIARVDNLLVRLSPSGMGDVGQAFLNKFRATGCSERLDRQKAPKHIAFYLPHHVPFNKRLPEPVNRIDYSIALFGSFYDALSVTLHERIHAMQYASCAAVHADPLNAMKTGVCLSPRDYLIVNIAAEMDAYVKQAWLMKMMEEQFKGISAGTSGLTFPVSTKELRQIENLFADMSGVFQAAAKDVGCRNLPWSGQQEASPLADYYAQGFLTSYAQNIRLYRAHNNGRNPVFCRLQAQDLRELGRAFGPCTFGDPDVRPEFLKSFPLSDANRQALADLYTLLDVIDSGVLPLFAQPLPTLDEALHAQGKTRQDMLEQCRAVPSPPSFWQRVGLG